MAEVRWVRGCGEAGNCVEVAAVDPKSRWFRLRNSDDPGHEIVVSLAEWREFIRAVKAGEFDEVGR